MNTKIDFVDESVGGCIPKQFIPVIMKNFLRIAEKGGWYVPNKSANESLVISARVRFFCYDSH